jgi:hypothetical protein
VIAPSLNIKFTSNFPANSIFNFIRIGQRFPNITKIMSKSSSAANQIQTIRTPQHHHPQLIKRQEHHTSSQSSSSPNRNNVQRTFPVKPLKKTIITNNSQSHHRLRRHPPQLIAFQGNLSDSSSPQRQSRYYHQLIAFRGIKGN